MTVGLLPPSATPQERAAEAATARVGDADGDDAVRHLWNPAACVPAALDQLRWALDAPGHWPEDDAGRRRALREALPLHRVRGTRAALDRSLRDAGVVADVAENPGGVRHTVRIDVLNSAALDAGLATAEAVRGLAERTGRATVRYQVALSAGATLSAGLAAAAAPPLSLARATLEIAA